MKPCIDFSPTIQSTLHAALHCRRHLRRHGFYPAALSFHVPLPALYIQNSSYKYNYCKVIIIINYSLIIIPMARSNPRFWSSRYCWVREQGSQQQCMRKSSVGLPSNLYCSLIFVRYTHEYIQPQPVTALTRK